MKLVRKKDFNSADTDRRVATGVSYLLSKESAPWRAGRNAGAARLGVAELRLASIAKLGTLFLEARPMPMTER